MAVKVGSFAKSTNIGVPVDQAVTGLGFKPRAIIFWTGSSATDGASSDGIQFAIGFAARDAADAITEGSQAICIEDNQATASGSSRAAAKCLTIVGGSESLIAECDLKSFDTGGFTVTWTTNNNVGYIIHYMALGGASMTAAKVVGWQQPETTGNYGVTGAGFTPDCVLHVVTTVNTAPDNSRAYAFMQLSAMTSAAQWATWVASDDGDAAADDKSGYYASQVFQALTPANANILCVGDYVSMDADGFTIDFTTAGATADRYVYSLCMDGGSYWLGTIESPNGTGAGTQAYTGVGFQPEGLFAFSSGITAEGSITDINASYGASDGTNHHMTFISEDDGSDPTDSLTFDTDDTLVVTAADPVDVTWDEAATVSAFGADGFTLSYSARVTSQYDYQIFAFAGGAAATATARSQVMWI